MFRPKLMVATIVLSLGLLACSNADDDGNSSPELPLSSVSEASGETLGTEAEYLAALEGNLTADDLIGADAAPCVATAWLEDLGVEPFTAARVAPQDVAEQADMSAMRELGLPMETSHRLVAAIRGCDIDPLAAALDGEGRDISDEAAACLRETLTADLMDGVLAANLAGNLEDPEASEIVSRYQTTLRGCGVGD